MASVDANHHARRKQSDHLDDFALLPRVAEEDIFFFGGEDYLPLFAALTKDVQGRRAVFYRIDPTTQKASEDGVRRISSVSVAGQ